jgi:hypothetical protein
MSRFADDFEFEKLGEFNTPDIDTLVSSRLDDLAEQIYILHMEGRHYEAQLLKEEGLSMAEAMDEGLQFLYINDLSESR